MTYSDLLRGKDVIHLEEPVLLRQVTQGSSTSFKGDPASSQDEQASSQVPAHDRPIQIPNVFASSQMCLANMSLCLAIATKRLKTDSYQASSQTIRLPADQNGGKADGAMRTTSKGELRRMKASIHMKPRLQAASQNYALTVHSAVQAPICTQQTAFFRLSVRLRT